MADAVRRPEQRPARRWAAAGVAGVVLAGVAAASVPARAAGPTPGAVAGPGAVARESFDRPASGVFQLAGHGWGHGRGMSQHGALGAGQTGVTGETIVSTYYPATTRGVLAAKAIRVKLSADEGRDTLVAPATGLAVRDTASGAAVVLPTGAQAWRALVSGDSLLLQQSRSGVWRTYTVAGRSSFAGPLVFSGPSYVRVRFPDGSARDYRGTVSAVRNGTGALVTVNTLSLEDYLRGVVPRESPSSWNAAALQAQAIAARSYSAYKRAHVASTARYDICDTTMCQVYGGARLYPAGGGTSVAQEAASTDAAIGATAGVVRLYQGAPIFAEFSSSNGGWSTAGSVPYLAARADPWDGITGSSAHAWSAALRVSDLERRYTALGTFRSLEVVGRDGNGDWGGRVTSVVLHGESAGRATTVTTTGAGVYNSRPWPSYSDGLRSSWWRVVGTPPAAPTALAAVAGDTSATLRWQPPASVGSSPLTAYVVTVAPGGRLVTVRPDRSSAIVNDLPNGVAHAFTVRARNAAGSSPASVASAPVTPAWHPGGYVPLPGARVYDSSSTPIGAGGVRSVPVLGTAGVPYRGVTSVVLTVTAVRPSTNTWVSVWPTGSRRPGTTAVLAPVGRTRSATVVVRPGSGGQVDVGNGAGSVRVFVEVVGYHAASGGSRLVAVTPRRLLDTRRTGGAVASGAPRTVQVTGPAGAAGVPAGATAVAVTLTATGASAGTWLTAHRADAVEPAVSQLSLRPGETVSALAVVPLSADGRMRLANRFGSAHVVVDVQGWYLAGATGPGRTAASAGARIWSGPVGPGASVAVPVTGRGGVPSTGVGAVVASVSFPGGTANSDVVAWAGGARSSGVSLHGTATVGATGTVVVPVAADGTVRLYNSAGTGRLVVDVLGWVAA